MISFKSFMKETIVNDDGQEKNSLQSDEIDLNEAKELDRLENNLFSAFVNYRMELKKYKITSPNHKHLNKNWKSLVDVITVLSDKYTKV